MVALSTGYVLYGVARLFFAAPMTRLGESVRFKSKRRLRKGADNEDHFDHCFDGFLAGLGLRLSQCTTRPSKTVQQPPVIYDSSASAGLLIRRSPFNPKMGLLHFGV